MTPSELKRQHEEHNPHSLFFSRNNMKFAGDTMRNYYVPAETIMAVLRDGTEVECYELQRRHPVKCGLNSSAYFDTQEFAQVLGIHRLYWRQAL